VCVNTCSNDLPRLGVDCRTTAESACKRKNPRAIVNKFGIKANCQDGILSCRKPETEGDSWRTLFVERTDGSNSRKFRRPGLTVPVSAEIIIKKNKKNKKNKKCVVGVNDIYQLKTRVARTTSSWNLHLNLIMLSSQ